MKVCDPFVGQVKRQITLTSNWVYKAHQKYVSKRDTDLPGGRLSAKTPSHFYKLIMDDSSKVKRSFGRKDI